MSEQSKISSFFSPSTAKKRPSVGLGPGKDWHQIQNTFSPKRSKSDGVEEGSENKAPPSPTKGTVVSKISEADVKNKSDGATENRAPLSPTKEAVVPLSPEQKQQVANKRLHAKMTLVEKDTYGVVNNFGESWFEALEPEFKKTYFHFLCKFVTEERRKGTVYPPEDEVFSFTQACNIKDVKVVILGQDPYHGPKQAHGLCFSVQKGVQPPPSLVNMYKLLATDIEGFKAPGHGYLNGWAQQGVLLLNAVLTVRARQANSHKDKGWEKLTDALISWLNKNHTGLVFILWGAYAQKKGSRIDLKKHKVLKGVHPSPLSAHRGFFNCAHFSQCNELLQQLGQTPIDWNKLP